MACPNCSKTCRGAKGLATHQRGCKAPIDVEQAPDGHIDSEKPCPKCSKIFCNERSLRTHNRHCQGSPVDELAPADPLADKVCSACSKVCKGIPV